LGTSNWQQIPFCIDALMKMAPRRVLDVGVGFGRWGMIVREFCDVWYQRIFKEDWQVHVEGIEAFPKSITDYHRDFYNKIHIGDAAELIPTLPGPWDVTIYGDVLEHFTKEKAHELLRASLETSDYVIVNIPIGEEYDQGELYGNAFEAHLSSWQPDDFRAFGLVRYVLLKDFRARDYGSFVLSRHDPKDLRTSLFSQSPALAPAPADLGDRAELDRILERVAEQSFELGFIKQSASYRLAGRLRKAALGKIARKFKTGDTNRVSIRPRPGTGANRGPEAWVLSVHAAPGEPGVPWDFVERTPEFSARPAEGSAYGHSLCGVGGELSVRTGPDPKVRFLTHSWSTPVEVEFNGRRETIDLGSYEDGTIDVYPARAPMVGPGAKKRSVQNQPHAQSMIEASPQAASASAAAPEAFTREEQAIISRLKDRRPAALAIHCPRWLGVTSSTRALFEQSADLYPLPSNSQSDPAELTEPELQRHARVLAASGVKHLILSGGDMPHLRLAEMVRAIDPEVVCDMLWHGSYVQVSEDYAWLMLRSWIQAVREGKVRSILTVKAGMEDFFRANGVPSALLHNYVPGETVSPPALEGGQTHVGLWLAGPSFRKTPHAMICALSMLSSQGSDPCGGDGACPDLNRVRLHAAGLDPRARELIEFLNIPANIAPRPLPQDRLLQAIRATHLSLYVTFSECCPMLPLESLQQGVPCLVGPVSHLFEDNKFLHDRLVVPCPDRADVIAAYARRAIIEREEIIQEWARYSPRYNAMARETVARFLKNGPAAAVPHLPSSREAEVAAGAPAGEQLVPQGEGA
jgi:hypothetical protein